MKVDELLKCLENVEINEDEINEKREIVEYLTHTLKFDDSPRRCYCTYYYIITKDKKLYKIRQYRSYGISPNDAYAYVMNTFWTGYYHPVVYYYPFLYYKLLLLCAYLSKLGLEEKDEYVAKYIAPATGLKYVSAVLQFPGDKRVVIEVADIDTVAANLNLSTIVQSVLGSKLGTKKYINTHKFWSIVFQLDKQKFFAGYTFNEAYNIINSYYEGHNASLAKDVEAIRNAYTHIFKPYRVVYDLKTKRFIFPPPETPSVRAG